MSIMLIQQFLALPNKEILNSLNTEISKEDQRKCLIPYLQRHLFDEDTKEVVNKIFKDVAPEIVKNGFGDLKKMDPNHIMACEAFIPKEYFKILFNNPNTSYNFLTLQYDSYGIPTGNSPVYDIFDNFIIYKNGQDLKLQMLMNNIELIRDYNIERFIIANQITHIQINLISKNLDANYVTNDCSIYPKGIERCPDIFDTIYITDYFLKYLNNIFIKIVIFDRTIDDTLKQSFIFSHCDIDNQYKVSSLINFERFIKIAKLIQEFKKEISDIEKVKESHIESENGNVSVMINYEDIDYSCEKTKNEFKFHLEQLKPKPMVTYKVNNKYQDLPLYAKYFESFITKYYNEIASIFPIYRRLENIYRLCAINCIIMAVRDSDDITDFTIEQKFVESRNCSYVGNFASSILCSGGIVIKPTKYTITNYSPRPTTALKNKTDNNKVYVVRRKLGGIIKTGAVSHSAILQKYNNKYYLTEVLETGVRQVEVDMKDIDHNTEFQFDDYQWSKQQNGNIISEDYNPDIVKKKMENVFNSRGKYNVYTNNCHLAQQDVRRALGIDVENPYKPL